MYDARNFTDPKTWVKDNQTALMEHWLGITPDSRLHRSPFRKDRKPSCSFYTAKTGTLYFKDWASDEVYSVLDVIKLKNSCSYAKALEIARATEIKEMSPFEKIPKVFTFIPLPDYHDYWRKLGVSKELLHEYSVHNVKYVYVDGDIMWKANKFNPIFAYDFPSGHTKFYRPLTENREKKWLGNAQLEDINGLHQLPWYSNLLIVTKSMKDVLVLKSYGFSAIAPQGESNTWEASLVTQLKRRFKNILILYDNDEAGINHGRLAAQRFSAPMLLLKRTKDISDHVSKFGRKKTFRCLKKQLAHLFAL